MSRIFVAHLGPIDLLTGANIDTASSLSWQNAKEYHHLFPRDYLRQKGTKSRDANCLANIVLLTSANDKRISNRAPSDYLKSVTASAKEDLPDWLTRNLVSKAASDAAMRATL